MKYENVTKGIFLSRPNRFVAHIVIDGRQVVAHVKNTGRCKELLVENAIIYAEDHGEENPGRKTRYSVIAVEKMNPDGCRLINIDSQVPNKVVKEAILSGGIKLPGFPGAIKTLKGESVYGTSRFDFFAEGHDGSRAYIEVKGVTLEEDGIVRFPDAPTERGVKHIRELSEAASEGYFAYLIFLVQMKGVLYFEPNDRTHLRFGQALRSAAEKNVTIMAYDCWVKGDSIELGDPVSIKLSSENNPGRRL